MTTRLLIGLLTMYCLATKGQTLEGDWMYVQKKGEIYSKHGGFRFKADSVWEFGFGGTTKYGRYQIKDDTLSFGNSYKEIVNYRIKLTSDSLSLTSSSGSTSMYYTRKLEYNGELNFEKIILTTELDNGSLTFTINKNGKAEFWKERNGKVTKQKFKIEKQRINEIDSVFKWSFIEHIDENIDYSSSFEEPAKLTITYNGGKRATFEGTLSYLPFRLRPMTWYLLNELRKRDLV